MAIMNVAAYGFTLIGTHRLVPEQFGAITALLGLLLIGNVASLGLQATGARRLATHTDDGSLTHSILLAGRRTAIALMVLCLLATPLIMWLLHIDSVVAVLLLAPTLGGLTLMGAQLGILQGTQRWTALASVYTSLGLARLVLGGGALLVHPSLEWAMAGLALGAVVPPVLGSLYVRKASGGTPALTNSLLRETAHGTHTLLAFFVIANADVLLARSLLDGRHSGYYAAGVIVAKACLFLPQFVIVIVFPSLANSPGDTAKLRRAILAVAGLGVCTVVGTLVLPDLVVTVIGGPEKYAALGPYTWMFAIAGSAYAVLQMVVYAAIAQQEKRAALAIWAGLLVLALTAALALAEGMTGVKTLVALTSGCALLLSATLAAGLHRRQSPDR